MQPTTRHGWIYPRATGSVLLLHLRSTLYRLHRLHRTVPVPVCLEKLPFGVFPEEDVLLEPGTSPPLPWAGLGLRLSGYRYSRWDWTRAKFADSAGMRVSSGEQRPRSSSSRGNRQPSYREVAMRALPYYCCISSHYYGCLYFYMAALRQSTVEYKYRVFTNHQSPPILAWWT